MTRDLPISKEGIQRSKLSMLLSKLLRDTKDELVGGKRQGATIILLLKKGFTAANYLHRRMHTKICPTTYLEIDSAKLSENTFKVIYLWALGERLRNLRSQDPRLHVDIRV